MDVNLTSVPQITFSGILTWNKEPQDAENVAKVPLSKSAVSKSFVAFLRGERDPKIG